MSDSEIHSPDLTGKPFRIDTSRGADSVAIVMSGALDAASTDQLDVVIREAEETGIGRIVLDLSEVSFVDSTGLSLLLAAKKRGAGRLKFVASKHEAVTRLLELTGTVEMLDYDTPARDSGP